MNEANNEVIEELKQAVDKVLEMSGGKFARANVEVSRLAGHDFSVEYLVYADIPGFSCFRAVSLEVAFAEIARSSAALALRQRAAELIRQAEKMEAEKMEGAYEHK